MMKRQLLIFLSLVVLNAAFSSSAIRPGELWLDDTGKHINAHGGGVLFHEGLYYWFGEHKTEGKGGNRANVGVGVYSSKDLISWNNLGVALSVSDDEQSPISKGCILERPKVIFNAKTEKFVMWFHLELKGQGYSAAHTGVAVSDNPEGPYRFLRSSRTNPGMWPVNFSQKQKEKVYDLEELEQNRRSESFQKAVVDGLYVLRDFEGGQMSRDMTLFVDDDGCAYHISASEENRTLHFRELTNDYLGFTGRYWRVFPGGHNEAPALFKHNGDYYMFSSGCTGWRPNPGRISVAKSIQGPWKALGNPCMGSVEENATTFQSQSTHVIPVIGKAGAFVFMGDRWRPENAIDGRYIWLPIEWEGDKPVLQWRDEWDLSVFE